MMDASEIRKVRMAAEKKTIKNKPVTDENNWSLAAAGCKNTEEEKKLINEIKNKPCKKKHRRTQTCN